VIVGSCNQLAVYSRNTIVNCDCLKVHTKHWKFVAKPNSASCLLRMQNQEPNAGEQHSM
jgi:hypothetical protein